MPIGKPIADLGDTGDADLKVSGFSLSAAVPTSFGGSSSGFNSSPSGSSAPGVSATGGFGSSGSNFTPAPDRTSAAAEAVKGGAESTIENTNTDWINNKWRPVMGWMYMLVCTCDFVVFPVLWSVLQALTHGNVSSQWQPLTLQGAGLFHLAMGAVLGVAAYGRTKEKLESKQ
jgi:hypothetical protein